MFPRSVCLLTVLPISVFNVRAGALSYGRGRRCTDDPSIRSEFNWSSCIHNWLVNVSRVRLTVTA